MVGNYRTVGDAERQWLAEVWVQHAHGPQRIVGQMQVGS